MIPIIIVVGYFVVFSLIFGLRSRKHLSGGGDFFGAKNRLGWFAVLCSFVLAPLGGGHTTAMIEMGNIGVGILWWGILCGGIFVPIFLQGFGVWFKRLGVDTFPQALGRVFGSEIKVYNSAIAPVGWLCGCIVEMIGISTVIYCLSGGRIPYSPWCILLAGVLNVLYILFGGMLQAAQMNIINAVMLFAGGFIGVFYMGGWFPGGFQGVADYYAAAGAPLQTNLFHIDSTILFEIMIPVVLLHVFSVSSEQAQYESMVAAKDEHAIRKGTFLGSILNSFAATPWVTMALIALAVPSVVSAIGSNGRLSVAELALQAMPPWLIGVVMTGLMCALLSTSSAATLGIATVVTDDILVPAIGRDKVSEKKRVMIGRLIMVAVTLGCVIPGLFVSVAVPLMYWGFSLSIPLVINYLIGLFWQKNKKAAWINLIVPLGVNFWWTFARPDWCPDVFSLSFYPVFAVTIILGIILNLAMPGEPGLMKEIRAKKKAKAA